MAAATRAAAASALRLATDAAGRPKPKLTTASIASRGRGWQSGGTRGGSHGETRASPTGDSAGRGGEGEGVPIASSPGGLRVRTPEDEEMADEPMDTETEAEGIDNAADVARYAGIGVAEEGA